MQIYDRPASADNAKWKRLGLGLLLMLVSLFVSLMMYRWMAE